MQFFKCKCDKKLDEIISLLKEIKTMSQALDDAFAAVSAKLDAEELTIQDNAKLLSALSADIVALTAQIQANPTDPAIVAKLQDLGAKIDAHAQEIVAADAANPVPPTP